jgi:quinol monooxygenase YgiN
VWVYELYTDQAALDTHSKSPAMAEAIGAFGGLLGGAPELNILTPTSS